MLRDGEVFYQGIYCEDTDQYISTPCVWLNYKIIPLTEYINYLRKFVDDKNTVDTKGRY